MGGGTYKNLEDMVDGGAGAFLGRSRGGWWRNSCWKVFVVNVSRGVSFLLLPRLGGMDFPSFYTVVAYL